MDFLNKVKDTVRITLAVAEAEQVRLPGDSIHVDLGLEAEAETAVRGGTISLIYLETLQVRYNYVDDDNERTGRETQTAETIYAQHTLLGDALLPAGHVERFAFDFTLPPDAPHSANGRLVKSQWWIKVNLDRPNAFDIVDKVEIPVAAARVAGYSSALEESYPEIGTMQLHLPQTAWLAGGALRGELCFTPEQRLEGSLSLTLRQHDHVWGQLHGSEKYRAYRHRLDPHEESQRVAQLTLADRAHFAGGEAQRLPFEIALPADAAHSFEHEHGRIFWTLTAELKRPFRWRAPLAQRTFPLTVELDVLPRN